MDELQAVNIMLGEIGSDAVSDLTIGHPDVANARRTLDKAHRQIQRKGWWFNTDYNVTLQPEPVTKKIKVANLVRIDVPGFFVVERNGYLYDRDRQSYQFETNLTALRMVAYLTWDNLPDVVKDAALYKASSDFVRVETEDGDKEKSLYNLHLQALADVRREDLLVEQHNMYSKPRVFIGRAGVRPYRESRTRSRFFGTPDA